MRKGPGFESQLDHKKKEEYIYILLLCLKKIMYYVYILYSKSLDRFYVGYTNNLDRRLSEHNRKKGKFTDAGIPWEIVYSESFDTKRQAEDHEKFIKSRKSRAFIMDSVEQRVEHPASREGPGLLT